MQGTGSNQYANKRLTTHEKDKQYIPNDSAHRFVSEGSQAVQDHSTEKMSETVSGVRVRDAVASISYLIVDEIPATAMDNSAMVKTYANILLAAIMLSTINKLVVGQLHSVELEICL